MNARRRRLVLAALGLCAGLGDASAGDAQPAREALRRDGEAALSRGETAAALEAFERAAALGHDADTEMGLVRAQLQAGQYRRAMAFCAHVAGEHGDHPAAPALYAWLLRMGGQAAPAQRVLGQALQALPDDPVLRAVQAAFGLATEPVAGGVLLALPQRMAPYAVMFGSEAPPPASARSAGGAVLVDGGRRAVVPASLLEGVRSGTSRLWVRNGLGHTAAARLDAARTASDALRVLRLSVPLEPVTARTRAEHAPFAGTAVLTAQYPPAPSAGPAWPWLRLGFLAGVDAATGQPSLGIEVAEGALGGPVFGVDGALVGIALRDAGGEARFLPVRAWAEDGAAPAAAVAPTGPTLPRPLDEAFEGALRMALQFIVADA